MSRSLEGPAVALPSLSPLSGNSPLVEPRALGTGRDAPAAEIGLALAPHLLAVPSALARDSYALSLDAARGQPLPLPLSLYLHVLHQGLTPQ